MSYEQRARKWLNALRGNATLVELSPEALAEWAESIAAEARATAIEGCCAAAEALREGPNTPTIGALVETMRRTIDTPRPDVRLVAREDLAHALGQCDCLVPMMDFGDEEEARKRHYAIIDRLRAGEE